MPDKTATLSSPANGALTDPQAAARSNHFFDIVLNVPSCFACAIAALTFCCRRGSFLFMPTKHGEFLMTNFGSGRRGGFFARIAAATMLPAAIS